MNRDRADDAPNPHLPATARERDAPTDDDYDHTGNERGEDHEGGTRGGGDRNSPLGR